MNYRWNFYEFVKTRGLGFLFIFIRRLSIMFCYYYHYYIHCWNRFCTRTSQVYGNLETSTTMMIIKIYGIDGRRWKQNQTLKSKRGLSSMRISADKIRDPYIILSVSKCNGTVFSILECKTTNLLVANTKERKKQFTIV